MIMLFLLCLSSLEKIKVCIKLHTMSNNAIDLVFDKIIDTNKNLITALIIYSKHILPRHDTSIVRDKYVKLIRKYYPSLKSMNEYTIKKKIDSLVERIYFLEHLRNGCIKHNIQHSENEIYFMTNEEILEEANYLLQNDHLESDNDSDYYEYDDEYDEYDEEDDISDEISYTSSNNNYGCSLCNNSTCCSLCSLNNSQKKKFDISSEVLYTDNTINKSSKHKNK